MVATFARSIAKAAAEKYDFPTTSDLSLLHNSPGTSDVTLHIGEGRRRLYAHEHILNLSSAYFGRMLDRDSFFREAQTRVVHKPNWSWEVAFALTRFLYTGRLDDVPAEILAPLYCAADEAQVEILVAEMLRRERDFLFMLCDPASAEALLRFALIANLGVLARAAATYLELLVGNPRCRQLLYPPADCECNWPLLPEEVDSGREPPAASEPAGLLPSSARTYQQQSQRPAEPFASSSQRQAAPRRHLGSTSSAGDSPPLPSEPSASASTCSPPSFDPAEEEYSLTSPERLPLRGLPDVHQHFCPLFWLSTPLRPQPREPRETPQAAGPGRRHQRPWQVPVPPPYWNDLPTDAANSVVISRLPYQRKPSTSGTCPETNAFVSTLVIEKVPVNSRLARGFTEGAKDDPVPHLAFKCAPFFHETISLEAVANLALAPRLPAYAQKAQNSPSKPSGKEAVASLLSDLRKHTSPQKPANSHPALETKERPVGLPVSLTYIVRQSKKDDMLTLMRHLLDKANPAPSQEEINIAKATGMSHPARPFSNQRFLVRLNLWPAPGDVIKAANLQLKPYGCKFRVYNETQAGYGPRGASTIDALIDGRPAHIRKTMVLLEEMLWKDAKPAGRASYDANGTLIIYAPQRNVLLRIMDTQEHFKCDFTRNCLFFDRSPEELKRILGDLDSKVFKDGNLDPAPSPGSAAAPAGVQWTPPRHPPGNPHSHQPVSSCSSQACHIAQCAESPVFRGTRPGSPPAPGAGPRLSPPKPAAQPTSGPASPRSACAPGFPNVPPGPSGNPKTAPAAWDDQQHQLCGAGSPSVSAGPSYSCDPTSPTPASSSSTTAASRSCGRSAGPGRLVIRMPKTDDGVFDSVVQPGAKPCSLREDGRICRTSAITSSAAVAAPSAPPTTAVGAAAATPPTVPSSPHRATNCDSRRGFQPLPTPPASPVLPDSAVHLETRSSSTATPAPATPLPSSGGKVMQAIAPHQPRRIEYCTDKLDKALLS